MSSNGYDVAIKYMQSPLQFMLPIKYEGDMQSWAHSASDRISRYKKEGGFANELIARLEALVFPFISGCSTLQKLGTTSTSLTNCLLSHQHKDESISKEARELFLLVGALFYSVVIWLPSLIDPTILTRPDKQPRPPTTSEEEVERIREELVAVRKEILTAKQDSIAKMFPIIRNSPIAVSELALVLDLPEMDGITLQVSPKPSRANYVAISRAFWGTPSGETFDYRTAKYPVIFAEEPHNKRAHDETGYLTLPELSAPDFVIKPEGMLSLSIDCKKISPAHLTRLLEKEHEIGQLELVDASLDLLLALDERSSTLTQIHSLVLRDSRSYQEKTELPLDKINLLSERFPRIACFDFRDCRLSGSPEALSEGHIVFHTDYRIERGERHRVGHLVETEHNNVLDQLNAFNQKVFAIVNKERLDPQNQLEISQSFPPSGTNVRFHCFDFCVTKLSFLRGTDVRSNHLKSLMPKLSYSFPNLKVFDLGHCTLLDSDAFQHLGHYPVSSIYLNGCDAIFGRRHQIAAEARVGYRDNPNYLYINRRDYLLQLDTVARGVIYLYERGTSLIRFDKSKLFTQAYTQQEIRDVDTYEKYVISAFRRSLFPAMDALAQPPRSLQVKVDFSESFHEGV